MSDESNLGEIESQAPLAAHPDHAAELQDVVRSVARLRRWSRFSVLWIVTACLSVFGAILFAERDAAEQEARAIRAEDESAVLKGIKTKHEPMSAENKVAELQRENDQLKDERLAAASKTSELTARALRAEEEAAELRRENDELKRVAGLESMELRVGLRVDLKAEARECAKFEVAHNWPALYDCAAKLGVAGKWDEAVATQAHEFREKSTRELEASLASSRLKEAIADGNLREARNQLNLIGMDSFYFQDSDLVFRAAEAIAVAENLRKAQALAAKNDCDGVKRLQTQTSATSTPAVSGAVAAVAAKCVDTSSMAARPR